MSHGNGGGEATFKVFRGNAQKNEEIEYKVPVEPGMVVLDAIHWIQANEAPDLAVRWNCKAAKCGSCSAEVNGKPALMCKSRLDHFPAGEPIRVRPMKTFPIVKDLVTDVSWNFEVNKRIRAVQAAAERGVEVAAERHRSRAGVPQVHRVLPLPGRVPRAAQPRAEAPVRGPALPGADRRARDAPDRR
jgi:succinate dehydrogenase/fumarate reductase iron-sulfur protein